MTQNLIFDIKRFAINDGPGIRLVVFFKGCNLRCAWCHNPEGISAKAEKMVSQAKCIRCGDCTEACREGSITMTEHGIFTDNKTCIACGQCAEVCPTRATEMTGKSYSISELMALIEGERIFFEQSGGGVTLSGGEPLLHPDIVKDILDECRKRGIHTAIDTAGNVDTKILLEVTQKADLFLYDLKMMDDDLHRQHTHSGNANILHNLKILSETGARIIIRIPLMGGINDTEDNIRKSAEFTAGLAGDKKEVHLLPYHNIAQSKYTRLGQPENYIQFKEPDKDSLVRAVRIFAEFGISAKIGG